MELFGQSTRFCFLHGLCGGIITINSTSTFETSAESMNLLMQGSLAIWHFHGAFFELFQFMYLQRTLSFNGSKLTAEVSGPNVWFLTGNKAVQDIVLEAKIKKEINNLKCYISLVKWSTAKKKRCWLALPRILVQTILSNVIPDNGTKWVFMVTDIGQTKRNKSQARAGFFFNSYCFILLLFETWAALQGRVGSTYLMETVFLNSSRSQ